MAHLECVDNVSRYEWLPGSLVQPELISKLADLYSGHYGVWSSRGRRPGQHVKLGPERVREWLEGDTYIVWAVLLDEIIGYAITVQSAIPKLGQVAWVRCASEGQYASIVL